MAALATAIWKGWDPHEDRVATRLTLDCGCRAKNHCGSSEPDRRRKRGRTGPSPSSFMADLLLGIPSRRCAPPSGASCVRVCGPGDGIDDGELGARALATLPPAASGAVENCGSLVGSASGTQGAAKTVHAGGRPINATAGGGAGRSPDDRARSPAFAHPRNRRALHKTSQYRERQRAGRRL